MYLTSLQRCLKSAKRFVTTSGAGVVQMVLWHRGFSRVQTAQEMHSHKHTAACSVEFTEHLLMRKYESKHTVIRIFLAVFFPVKHKAAWMSDSIHTFSQLLWSFQGFFFFFHLKTWSLFSFSYHSAPPDKHTLPAHFTFQHPALEVLNYLW